MFLLLLLSLLLLLLLLLLFTHCLMCCDEQRFDSCYSFLLLYSCCLCVRRPLSLYVVSLSPGVLLALLVASVFCCLFSCCEVCYMYMIIGCKSCTTSFCDSDFTRILQKNIVDHAACICSLLLLFNCLVFVFVCCCLFL